MEHRDQFCGQSAPSMDPMTIEADRAKGAERKKIIEEREPLTLNEVFDGPGHQSGQVTTKWTFQRWAREGCAWLMGRESFGRVEQKER